MILSPGDRRPRRRSAAAEEEEIALSSHLSECAERLQHDVQARLNKAGVEVIGRRLS